MLQKLGLKQVIRCFILAVFLVKSFGLQKSLVLQKLLYKLSLIQFTLLSIGIPFCSIFVLLMSLDLLLMNQRVKDLCWDWDGFSHL